MSVALQEGAVFANRYRIVRCIAAGGMGAVYEVIHLETERRRALKVMLAHIVGSAELRERFKREARVAAAIESEFIVDVFDAGVDEATQMPFLVMELLKGEELGKRLERLGRFSPGEVVSYLHQTSLALDKTHKANIVHRDLKPENLFLTEREDGAPRVKVLDFGIAKLVADGSTHANATRSVGTPLYMSPEQFKSGTKVSPQSDIYALGMMAYTLIVGEPYWADEASGDSNVFAFAATVMNGPQEPASARSARKGVPLPPSFDAWFRCVCSVNPHERFATASSAIAGLAEALGLPPIQSAGISGGGLHGNAMHGGGGSNPSFTSNPSFGSHPGLAASRAGTSGVANSAGGLTTPANTQPKKSGAGGIIAVGLGVFLVAGGLGVYLVGFRRPAVEPDHTTSIVAATPPPAPESAAPTPPTPPPPQTPDSVAAPPASVAVVAPPPVPQGGGHGVKPPPAAPPTAKGGQKPPPTGAATPPPAGVPTYSRD